MATGDVNGGVTLWDVTDPDTPRHLGEPSKDSRGSVDALAFALDGYVLTAASAGVAYKGNGLAPPNADGVGSVRLWDVTDPAAPRLFGSSPTGHTGKLTTIDISPDGQTLAYGGVIGEVHLWDIGDPANPRRIGRPLPVDEIQSLAFSPDGGTLAVGGRGTAALFDVADLSRPVGRLPGPPVPEDDMVRAVRFMADSRTLAVGASDGVRLWDVSAMPELRRDGAGVACLAAGGGLDRTQWAAAVPGLDWEATCAEPATSAPSDVRRFGESAAAFDVLDRAAARERLIDTFAPGTSILPEMTLGPGGRGLVGLVRLVPAHPARKKIAVADQDKSTGVFYDLPRLRVRDPAVQQAALAPASPDEFLGTDRVLGVKTNGQREEDDGRSVQLDVDPAALAGGARRAVDVFSVASFRNVRDEPGQLIVVHYTGTWILAAGPDGQPVAVGVVQPGQTIPIPDQFFFEPAR